MGKRPPLDEWLSLFHATIAAEGTTTGAGAAAGTSIIDAGLIGAGANSFFTMMIVLYPGQPLLVDSQDITGFNTVTGEVIYAGAYKGVAAAIPAGVPYKIVTFRFVPAEVAALTALVTALIAVQGLSTFAQEAAGATVVNGLNWVDLLDESAITIFTEIWGIQVTKAGAWAGNAVLRITTGADVKIFPFAVEAVEGTDFIDTIVWMFPSPVYVPIASGYKVQFRSDNGADGAGLTLALNELAIIQRG